MTNDADSVLYERQTYSHPRQQQAILSDLVPAILSDLVPFVALLVSTTRCVSSLTRRCPRSDTCFPAVWSSSAASGDETGIVRLNIVLRGRTQAPMQQGLLRRRPLGCPPVCTSQLLSRAPMRGITGPLPLQAQTGIGYAHLQPIVLFVRIFRTVFVRFGEIFSGCQFDQPT